MNWMVTLIVKALQKALVDEKLNAIIGLLKESQGKEEKLMAEIAGLETKIQALIAAVSAAVLLIQGFPARLEEAGVDPAKIAALETEVAAATANLTAVVDANVPAPPA